MATRSKPRRSRPLPPGRKPLAALALLARERALQTLVRGAFPPVFLRRLLRDALPSREAREMPEEIWGALAAGLAVESDLFGEVLAQALHDRLAWDREPSSPEEWARLGAERPLEALWMAALSEDRAVRRGFSSRAAEWLAAYRSSPQCRPPSWEFVEGVLDVHAQSVRAEHDLARTTQDLERRLEAERERADDLREELKRLRRETSELRAERAALERKAAAREPRAGSGAPDAGRADDLERRLRKSEKENEHLRRELERGRAPVDVRPPSAGTEPGPPADAPAAHAVPSPALAEEANPRRRVLRQVLGKLFKKGQIGASHTHEDNVYRR